MKDLEDLLKKRTNVTFLEKIKYLIKKSIEEILEKTHN